MVRECAPAVVCSGHRRAALPGLQNSKVRCAVSRGTRKRQDVNLPVSRRDCADTSTYSPRYLDSSQQMGPAASFLEGCGVRVAEKYRTGGHEPIESIGCNRSSVASLVGDELLGRR